MPVEIETSSISHVGDGAQTSFPTTFSFGLDTDLTVQAGPVGALVTQVLGVDYTVTGAGAAEPGGSVDFLVAPDNGDLVVITRNTPITQLTNFVTSGPFSAATITRALDKLTRICQSLKRRILALEALGSLVTVTDLGDAAKVDYGSLFTVADPYEDNFPLVLPVPDAGQVGWVFVTATNANVAEVFDEPPQVQFGGLDSTNINITRISGLTVGQEYSLLFLCVYL